MLGETARRLRPKKSHLFVSLLSILAGTGGAITALDGWNKLLEDLHLRKADVFVLAEQSAEGDFLRSTLRLVSARTFWIERYAGEVEAGFPSDDLTEAWKSYNAGIIDWNINYMMASTLAEKYFGQSTKDLLANINWLLRESNSCLNRIHYVDLYKGSNAGCHFPSLKIDSDGTKEDNVKALEKAMVEIDKLVEKFARTIE